MGKTSYNHVALETNTDYDDANAARHNPGRSTSKSLQRCAFFGQALLADVVIACTYHAVWVAIAFFFAALALFVAKRRESRGRLACSTPSVARTACYSARIWSSLLFASLVAIVVVEFWGVCKWLGHLNT